MGALTRSAHISRAVRQTRQALTISGSVLSTRSSSSSSSSFGRVSRSAMVVVVWWLSMQLLS